MHYFVNNTTLQDSSFVSNTLQAYIDITEAFKCNMKGLVIHVIFDFYIDFTVYIGLSACTAKSRLISGTNNTFIAAQMDFVSSGRLCQFLPIYGAYFRPDLSHDYSISNILEQISNATVFNFKYFSSDISYQAYFSYVSV